jgi:Polyketide cyclase / dehydrase and lipid transport
VRILKLGFISFIFLFLLITIISLFIPAHVRISRAINVHALPKEVLVQKSDFKNWLNWYPDLKKLPAGQIQFLNSSDGVVTKMNLKTTEVVLKKVADKEVITELKQPGKEPVLSGWNIIEYAAKDSITLQWYMDFKLNWYPWEKFASIMFEKSYGEKMETGLSNLKKYLEMNRRSLK